MVCRRYIFGFELILHKTHCLSFYSLWNAGSVIVPEGSRVVQSAMLYTRLLSNIITFPGPAWIHSQLELL